jgi:hypothetical protein
LAISRIGRHGNARSWLFLPPLSKKDREIYFMIRDGYLIICFGTTTIAAAESSDAVGVRRKRRTPTRNSAPQMGRPPLTVTRLPERVCGQ